MPGEHPDLDMIGAVMREEWRAEQEAATRDAASEWQHRRTLPDLLTEHLHRGDRLAFHVAGWRVTGVPEEVGADLVALRAVFGRVDVHLAPGVPVCFELFERSTAEGGRGVDAAGGSFRRALELREGGDEVSIGTVFDPDGVDGRLRVGADHVTITARMGAEMTVPIAHVSWVSARRQ
jgi:hypothetical protein